MVLHLATAVRLPVHHQYAILPLSTNMKATSAPARSRCCKSYWLSGVLRLPYWIEYSPDAEDHLRRLKAYRQSIVLDKVEEPLRYQPTVETKHRKLMRPNPLAPWELRIGDLRVYCDF